MCYNTVRYIKSVILTTCITRKCQPDSGQTIVVARTSLHEGLTSFNDSMRTDCSNTAALSFQPDVHVQEGTWASGEPNGRHLCTVRNQAEMELAFFFLLHFCDSSK